MSDKYFLTIIGGGASGLICAGAVSNKYKDKKILILEKESRVGKKILASGNGRCNLTNINADKKYYYGNDTDIIDSLYKNYGAEKVISYFESIGLLTKVESDGRVYPLSNTSSSVLNVLRNQLITKSVEERTDISISDISYEDDEYIIKTENDIIHTEKLLIATGGKSDHTGKENHYSESLLENFDFKINDTTPSLSPVKVKSDIIRSLSGIRAFGKATLIKDDKIIKTEYGDIQFTSDALSGICIFNLSRFPNKEDGYIIRLSLLADKTDKEIEELLIHKREIYKDLLNDELFTGIFHKKIGIALLKICGINLNDKISSLSDKDIESLSYLINHFDFETLSRNDYKNSQVTAGGIDISEIDINTFETKKYKNLFITGEALDIDGVCGGYNLQFAFSSGLCAADNI